MDISSIALQGLDQAQTQLDAAASNLANAGASSAGPDLNTADVAAQMVALTSAQELFEVNLATLKTADQIQQTTIDLLA